MEPAMAARYGLEQGWVGARGTRCFPFYDQPDFHPAPLHLDRYEAGHRKAGGVPPIDRFGDQSLYIQRHSDAAAFQGTATRATGSRETRPGLAMPRGDRRTTELAIVKPTSPF